jgi:hypothetical protein
MASSTVFSLRHNHCRSGISRAKDLGLDNTPERHSKCRGRNPTGRHDGSRCESKENEWKNQAENETHLKEVE